MEVDGLRLSRLLASRLCHDLGGMAGTLAGTMDLVGGDDPSMLEIAQETARTLKDRLRLYAAAWGGAEDDLDAAALAALLGAAPCVPRVGFDLSDLAPGRAIPARLVPLVLNLALLGGEALPRGGTVRLGGDAQSGIAAQPEGRGAQWPAALVATLAGKGAEALAEEGAARRLLGPLVVLMAGQVGWRVDLGLGAPGASGAPPLLLLPN